MEGKVRLLNKWIMDCYGNMNESQIDEFVRKITKSKCNNKETEHYISWNR